ncbi:MoaD/ThiS family protein [Candidatus Woesearchaeota archaeon]|nr:MoaD/ThiS family protein [Candidatus Woesearchaeota archaeon]
MNVFNEKNRTNSTLEFNGSVEQLLQHLNINSETVLVTRNNEILTEDELLSNDDTIEILSVVSGG